MSVSEGPGEASKHGPEEPWGRGAVSLLATGQVLVPPEAKELLVASPPQPLSVYAQNTGERAGQEGASMVTEQGVIPPEADGLLEPLVISQPTGFHQDTRGRWDPEGWAPADGYRILAGLKPGTREAPAPARGFVSPGPLMVMDGLSPLFLLLLYR